MKYYLKALQNYATFSGRTRRSEYLYYYLFNVLFIVLAIVLDIVFGTVNEAIGYGPITILYGLVVTLPGFAVAVRRLHDAGKSGWMILLILVPIVGPIYILILLFFTDSQKGRNKWGENPKEFSI